MKKEIMNLIHIFKERYDKEGFVILGIFGSYARGEETESSDIDILYEFKESFYKNNPGWQAYARVDEIRLALQFELQKKVDLACKSSLNEVAKKYILPEVVYV